jgi:hypothetical protein
MTKTYVASTNPNSLGQDVDGYFYPQDSMTFNFATPIRVLGIHISIFAQEDGTFQTSTSQGVVFSVYDPFGYDPYNNYVGQFVGSTSDEPIFWATIALTNPGPYSPNSFTLDTMRYTPLPPPCCCLAPAWPAWAFCGSANPLRPKQEAD